MVDAQQVDSFSNDMEFDENENAPASYSSLWFLCTASRISVWPRRGRWEIETFCLQLVLQFLNGAIKLLIFAFKFFSGIVIDHNIRINTMTFYDPLFGIL